MCEQVYLRVRADAELIFSRLAGGLSSEVALWSGEGLQAGVLVALTDEVEPQVILGRRAKHLRLHPGEVAFPGGKREPEDKTPWATAIREAREEIGLNPRLVHPLGALPALTTRSNFEVHPCVAKVPAVFDVCVDPAEIESMFLTPLSVFADPGHYRLEKMSEQGRSRMVPHYQLGNDNIWGITARVLVQLANLALDAGLDLNVTGD